MHNLYAILLACLYCSTVPYTPNPSIWQANTIYYIELILTSKNKLLYVKLCKMNITVAILYSDKVLSTYTGFCAFVAH